MEDTLRESEQRLSLALDAVSDGVWDWRIDTNSVYFSPRWYTMLGYEPYELPETYDTWRRLLHPADLPEAERVVDRHRTGSLLFFFAKISAASRTGSNKRQINCD